MSKIKLIISNIEKLSEVPYFNSSLKKIYASNSSSIFSEELTYDNLNRISQSKSKQGTSADKIYDYAYDTKSQLTAYNFNGALAGNFSYDFMGNRITSLENNKNFQYIYDLVAGQTYKSNNMLKEFRDMSSPQTKSTYTYFDNASLATRIQVAKGVAPLVNLWNKKSENFFYDHRNLLDKYYFNSQFSSGVANPEDNACFVIDPNAYNNRTEWQYAYNSSMAREQKRMYYTPTGLTSDPATKAGGVYPWQYSLLDASNKETVIYQGFVNKDNQIPCKTPALVNNDTWEELYCTYYNQTEMSKQYVLLYPVEFHSSQYASWRVNAQGDWVKSYKVFDHLGSLRVEGVGYGNSEQTYFDYKPFGGLEASGTNIPFGKAKNRLGYVDMPKDKECNLGDHGVRKYDSEVGRFLAIDPLWEKYHSMNPFQYSGNSPVMTMDIDGKIIIASSTKAQEAIRETVAPELQQHVQFDEAGKLNADLLKENMPAGTDKNSNYAVLTRMAANPTTVNVEVSNNVQSVDINGNDNSKNFNETYSAGKTLFPLSMGQSDGQPKEFSTNRNINIYLNPSSNTGRTLQYILAHELYGHARAYMLGIWPAHIFDENGSDWNLPLKELYENAERQVK